MVKIHFIGFDIKNFRWMIHHFGQSPCVYGRNKTILSTKVTILFLVLSVCVSYFKPDSIPTLMTCIGAPMRQPSVCIRQHGYLNQHIHCCFIPCCPCQIFKEKGNSETLFPITAMVKKTKYNDVDGLVNDCSNSSALSMEVLWSCHKPYIYTAVTS